MDGWMDCRQQQLQEKKHVRWFVGSLVRWFVGLLVRWFVGLLVRCCWLLVGLVDLTNERTND